MNKGEDAFPDGLHCKDDSILNEDFEDMYLEEANFSLHGESFCIFHPLHGTRKPNARATSHFSPEDSSSLDYFEARKRDHLILDVKKPSYMDEIKKNQESFDHLMLVIERNKSVNTKSSSTGDLTPSPTAVAEGDSKLKARTARKCLGVLFMIVSTGRTTRCRDQSVTRQSKWVTS
jgi:hypothetical protein